MINLNATLDNLIAMVVVLLALSLVVQAVQSAVKKMFKLKSRQIEESLAHLFQYVMHNDSVAGREPGASNNSVAQPGAAEAKTPLAKLLAFLARNWGRIKGLFAQSPFLRVFTTMLHPADRAYEDAGDVYKEVMDKFRAVGRTALSTRPILDSMSKGDLMKVVNNIAPKKLDGKFTGNVEKAITEFNNLLEVFKQWRSWITDPNLDVGTYLTADDQAKLVELQAKFKPLFSDLGLLAADVSKADEVGKVVEKITADIAGLRGVNFDDAQKVLDDVRGNVRRAAERARLDKQDGPAKTLDGLADALDELAVGFADFRRAYAAVFAKWVKLEESFDTVMQSFEERYTRGMKTAAIVISFFVVVFLNANFFSVYKEISTSDAKRDMIIQSRQQVIEALNKTPAAPVSTPPPGETPEQKAVREKREQDELTVQNWFRASQKEIDDKAALFEGYGFAPVKWSDFRAWFAELRHPDAPAVGAGGNRLGVSRWDSGDWLNSRKDDVKTLLGWLIMTLLLSVGAPFWQDFLESLFGVKNVLRKRSDTKNVEQESGAGQPRQS